MTTPAQRAADRMAADARENARREREALALAARVAAVPVLDASVGYCVCRFLYWLQKSVQLAHDQHDPFWCVQDACDAAANAARAFCDESSPFEVAP